MKLRSPQATQGLRQRAGARRIKVIFRRRVLTSLGLCDFSDTLDINKDLKGQEIITLVVDFLCSIQLCLVEAFQELLGLFVARFLGLDSLGQQKGKDLNGASHLGGKAAIQDGHPG